jgi:hypothetical protein
MKKYFFTIGIILVFLLLANGTALASYIGNLGAGIVESSSTPNAYTAVSTSTLLSQIGLFTGQNYTFPSNVNVSGTLSVAGVPVSGSAYSRAFTATVCASNASDTTNCDYTAASTQADIVLDQAITAVCAKNGGTVKLSAGLFNVSSSPTVSNCNNLTIEGDGAGTDIRLQTSTLSSGILISNSNNITVQNLQIDGNKLNVASSGFQYGVQSDINFTSSTNLTFQNLLLHDSKQGGITGDSSNVIKILNNTIYNNYDNGIFLRPTPSGGASVSGVTIANNIVYGQAFTGIQILCGFDFTIANNISHDNGGTLGQGSGIGASASASGTIQGNTSFNNNIQAINVDASQECNPSSTAVGSSNVIVSGNTAMNASSSDGDAGDITAEGSNHVTITGNNIFGGYFGINLAFERGIPDLNTVVSNNNIQSTANLGIDVGPGTTTSTVILLNNVVQNSGASAVYTNAPIFLDGGTYSGSLNNAEGIDLESGSNSSTIENAWIYNNTDNGILVDGTSSNDVIFNNTITNVSSTAQGGGLYEVSGAGPTYMIGNIITNQRSDQYYFNNASSVYSTLDNGTGNPFIGANTLINGAGGNCSGNSTRALTVCGTTNNGIIAMLAPSAGAEADIDFDDTSHHWLFGENIGGNSSGQFSVYSGTTGHNDFQIDTSDNVKVPNLTISNATSGTLVANSSGLISATTTYPYTFNATSTAVIITNTTTLTTLYSLVIPANTLGLTHMLKVSAQGTFEQNGGATQVPFNINLQFCGQTVASSTFTSTSAASQIGAWGMNATLANSSGTANQILSWQGNAQKGASNLTGSGAGLTTCDTTSNQTFTIQMQLTTSTPTMLGTVNIITSVLQ